MMRKLLMCAAWTACLLGLFTCCTPPAKRYVIGVSQCSEDIWREKQNAELRMGAYCQENVELRFAAAYDSDERQVQQIDSLVATGIDLLIVAPNQVQTISPAIDRAYDRGIPVIVFERKTSSQKHTAFISADNYEMGHQMGEYIATRLHGSGRVVEVMGLKGSSPAIERHNGFMDAMKAHPGIRVTATLQGDWTEESAYAAATKWLASLRQTDDGSRTATLSEREQPVDFVFAQNDRMAMGARRALMESQGSSRPLTTRFCGIDGLPGEGGGIQLVRDSVLDASYIYPTHGDRLLQLAVDILEGKPYARETRLMSALVTRDNARVLLMQSEETVRQEAYLDQLHRRADSYLDALATQRTITMLACCAIALLLVAIVLFYRYHLSKVTLQRERVVNTLWNLKPEDIQKMEEASPQKPMDASPAAVQEGKPDEEQHSQSSEPVRDAEDEEPVVTSVFITRFKEVVEARLADSELSIEDLAADMNLSRVQLYRKVKSVSGSTPIELLRTARLNRGYQLLITTDKSVSEVAYEVGFTAPSYFTKCFKDEFGQLPGDVRKK